MVIKINLRITPHYKLLSPLAASISQIKQNSSMQPSTITCFPTWKAQQNIFSKQYLLC